jgi:Stigma-specific protein, Stig1
MRQATAAMACSGACVSVSNNNANCGSCGRACATGSACSGGSCYLNDGQACTTGNQCLSGVCSTFYLDADGDGYGISTSIARCGTTPPSGYAVNSGDCCDSDGSAHPGQTSYFTTADGCGSYDYNCDGNETPLSHGPSGCGTITCFINSSGTCAYNGGCTCGGADPCLFHTTTACGQPYAVINSVCGDPQGVSCFGTTHGGAAGNQECN